MVGVQVLIILLYRAQHETAMLKADNGTALRVGLLPTGSINASMVEMVDTLRLERSAVTVWGFKSLWKHKRICGGMVYTDVSKTSAHYEHVSSSLTGCICIDDD